MINIPTLSELTEALEDMFRTDPESLKRPITLNFKDDTEAIVNSELEEGHKLLYYKFTYNDPKGSIIFQGNETIDWNRIYKAGELIGKDIMNFNANQQEFMQYFVKRNIDPTIEKPKLTWDGYMVFNNGKWVERRIACTTFSSWVIGGSAPEQESTDGFKISIDWNKKG